MTNLARFRADGRLDPHFAYSFAPTSQVEALALQNDDSLLIGGTFLTINGYDQNFIARLQIGFPKIQLVRFDGEGWPTLSVAAPQGASFHIEYSTDLEYWQTLTNISNADTLTEVTDSSGLEHTRFYRASITE